MKKISITFIWLLFFTLVACTNELEQMQNELTVQTPNTLSNYETFHIDTQDSLALVALYNATNGKKWHIRNGWLSKSPAHTWEGIGTEVIDGKYRVTVLGLTNVKLDGSIPDEIRNLSKLKIINFGYNDKLRGEIPAGLYELKNLISLRLQFTDITGELSSAIGNLDKLDTLDLWSELRRNPIVGTPDTDPRPVRMSGKLPKELGSLKQLRWMRIGRQNFTGRLPEEIGGMTNLNYLDIADSRLSGGIPASFGQLENLTEFYASGNQFNEPLPEELCLAQNLESLYLSDNQIPGSIPQNIHKLEKLNAIDLQNNRLTGEIPSSITQNKRLGLVYFNNNLLTGSIPETLGDSSPWLIHVNVSNNNLTGNVPAQKGKKTKSSGTWYTTFNVKNNRLTGKVDECYMQFEKTTRNTFLPQQSGYGFENLK